MHRALGPGLLKSDYRQCFAHELSQAGIPFRTEWPVPVAYGGAKLACRYRADLLVADELLVETKRADGLQDVHRAQILTHMRLAGVRVGLLINFNKVLLKGGIERFVL